MDENKFWFLKKRDCDECGVVKNEGNTTNYQIKRCRDCSRNPALDFFPKKHVHDHYEPMKK